MGIFALRGGVKGHEMLAVACIIRID